MTVTSTEPPGPYTQEQPTSIQEMFSSIAQTYDRGNALLSLGLHRYWNRTLIRETLVSSLGEQPGTFLDLCSGTGDIAFGFLKRTPHIHNAYLIDFCPDMLAMAKQKSKDPRLKRHPLYFIEGDAQDIPLKSEEIDAVTIAYGIRNVQSPRRCIAEVLRVLKPGGRLGILELTRPKNSLLNWGHSLYLKSILPVMGKLFLSNKEAYSYLCNSIQTFVSPDALEKVMKEEGFRESYQVPLIGGVATLIMGRK